MRVNEQLRRRHRRQERAIAGFGVLMIAVGVAIYAAIIFVAVHFIAKWW